MNNTFVTLVLSIAFFITVFKLYYRPTLVKLWDSFQTHPSSYLVNPIDKALCPVTGYKCVDENHCDCKQICGKDFEKVKLDEKDDIVLSSVERRGRGTYCLPKGFYDFLFSNGRLIYTTRGWQMVSRYPYIWNKRGELIACSSPYAQDNKLNFLFDRKLDRIVTSGESIDPHEKLPEDGRNRYVCQCNSKDVRENKMISLPEVPFICLTDYCKSETFNAAFVGWNGYKCDCGPRLKNMDPNDPTSPCVFCENVIKNDSLSHYVPCIDKNTLFSATNFYCPDTYGSDVDNKVYLEKEVFLDTSMISALRRFYIKHF
jgi:hypothetical protein